MKNNNNGELQKIISLGSSLNIEFILSLTEKEYSHYNINYNNINSLLDLKTYLECYNINNFYSPKKKDMNILNLILINSEDSLFNSLLFINRANKIKSFIELLIPFSLKFSEELNFMKDSLKYILENNFIFIEDFNLLDIKPNLNFSIKLIDDDHNVLNKKTFLITNDNNYKENNIRNNKEEEFDLFKGLNFEYDGTIFYTNLSDLFNCKKNSNNEIENFIKNIIKFYPSMKLCINYSNFINNYITISEEILNIINEIISLTDIFIFDEKESEEYFSMRKIKEESEKKANKKKIKLIKSHSQLNISKNNKSENLTPEDLFIRKIKIKKKQKNKIGIFFNEMKTITIIQQDSLSKLVLYHMQYEINYLKPNLSDEEFNEYNKIINLNFDKIKSIFLGGYLSRLFNNKSYNTCFVAGNESIKKIIFFLKNKIDFPYNLKYYEIKVKKPIYEKNKEEIKKENNFCLDCTNIENCKKKEYNPLIDYYCSSFLNNINNRKYLIKRGFINKEGFILSDPDKDKYSYNIRRNRLIKNYDNEQKRLLGIKSNNEIIKNQIKNLILNNPIEKNDNIDNLMQLSKVYNFELQNKKKIPSLNIKKIYNNGILKRSYYKDHFFKSNNHLLSTSNKFHKSFSNKNIFSSEKTFIESKDKENKKNNRKLNINLSISNFKKTYQNKQYMSPSNFREILSKFEQKLSSIP